MYNPDYPLMNEGWRCPQCGKIYAPHIPVCFKCNDGRSVQYSDRTDFYDVINQSPNMLEALTYYVNKLKEESNE